MPRIKLRFSSQSGHPDLLYSQEWVNVIFLHLWLQKLYRAFRFGTLWPISCSYPRHSQLTRHSLMLANGRIRQSLTALVLVCSIGMYVDGICVINVFNYSWIHSPIFPSFAQQIRRPLCVHHDLLLTARICWHLSQRLACIMERSVVVIWFLWGQKWIVAFRRGTFLFVLIIILKVLWPTSNRCWADVGGRHQPNVETTLGRHRTADIDPASAQHMFPCSFFFHSIICQNYLAPKSSQCWKQRSILV